MRKVVINRCYGGFSLSDKAYEWLIAHGVPVQKYIEQQRDPVTRLFLAEPRNEGEVIFDRALTPKGEDRLNDMYWEHPESSIFGRYWETWLDDDRSNPLLVQCVEELGAEANGKCAELKIVEIPDDVDYEIDDYDGMETIDEAHRSWS